ncbi:amidohydrolase [Streptomyces sp. NPDC050658]|uniref:amidohydrolase n=1 Tax=unclassified Streptomyces TaxID=2593676 RepID=UPI003440FDE8
MHADVIVTAHHIETLEGETLEGQTTEGDGRAADALAVKDGRIIAVGTADEIAALRGADTVVHAFPGATVLPGLVDVHAHPVWGSIEIGRGVDLSTAGTLDAVLDHIGEAAEQLPADAWITGYDLDVNVFDGSGARDGEPTGSVLAERFPGRPVSLMTRDAHALVISPRAVELAGLTGRETFTDASSVVTGPDGRPIGHILELQAMDLVFAHYPEVPVATAADYVRTQLDTLARHGLTGLHALDFTEPSLDVYRHIEAHGELPLRIRCSPLVPADSAPEAWRTIADQQSLRGRRWHVEGAKFMLDGTADNGTAWFDRPDCHGENREPLWRDLGAYRAAVRYFTERGIPTATHAIGDQAVRHALDVLEEAGPAGRAPHRIEHIESLPDDLLDRFARLGVVASLQPVHGTRHTRADGTDNWSRRIGPDRAARGWRTRDLLDHGAVVALGSDWPIGPGDPRTGLADCQLRRPVERPDTEPVQPAQAITAREAYTGMTRAAAQAAGTEHESGRMAPGCLADLTVFATNPLDLTPEDQAHNPVLATFVGGDIQHHHARNN